MSSTLASDPLSERLPEVVLAGVRLHAITEERCVAHVVAAIRRGHGGWIATANLDHLRRLQRPGEFQRAYAGASIVVADGMPLVWASRVQGTPLPQRVAGSDLIHSLNAGAAVVGARVFLLGGNPGTADAAADALRSRNPGLSVVGTACPPIGFERDEALTARLRETLRAARPDLVFVALGSPKQELLIEQLRADLPRAWWIGVGISFSFVAGQVRRAPRWLQRIGMEWLHRLLQEPRRLARRYLLDGPPFLARLFVGAAWQRVRGPRA